MKKNIAKILLSIMMMTTMSYADEIENENIQTIQDIKTDDTKDESKQESTKQEIKKESKKIDEKKAESTTNDNKKVTEKEKKESTKNTEENKKLQKESDKKTEQKVEQKPKNILKNTQNSSVVVRLSTQSKEELQGLYDRGYRVFEITVSTTRDRHIVLADNFKEYFKTHYGKEFYMPTIDEYFAQKMTSKNTQMSLGDINMFIGNYPDSVFFVNTLEPSRSSMEIIKNMSMENKKNLILRTGDVLEKFKEFDTITIVDLVGKDNIQSYISMNKDKNIVFLYQNKFPSSEDIEEIKKSGNLLYEINRFTVDNKYKESLDGIVYSVEDAIKIPISPVEKASKNIYTRPTIKNDRFIAHAGGRYAGINISNALQAMKSSYERGNRLLEIDFDWTLDGKIVQVHDWATFRKLTSSLEESLQYYMNYDDFKSKKMIYGLKQMSIDDTIEFLKNYPDVYIVTDVKEDNMKDGNIKALTQIAQMDKSVINRIIPQVYDTTEYKKIRNLGYDHIIYTLYRTHASTQSILEFSKLNNLYAVTMDNGYRVYTDLPNELSKYAVRVYTHTENDKKRAKDFILSGKVYGIYSDTILSDDELNS